MVTTQAKKKKPPTFHFLPKTRAKRLKKSWVQDHKIRSKWKAQKRRDGLTNQTSDGACQDDVDAGPELETTPDKPPTPSPVSSPDKRSLRNLRKIAYTSKPLHTPKTLSSPHGGGRETGQPNMKLHMNLLLEKIKRNFP